MAAAPEFLKANKMYGGWNKRYKHDSKAVGTPMHFTVFFPPHAEDGKVPILYYLSGLTCTDENVIQKSNAQQKAAELGIAIVAPDTSPRGLNIEGEADSYDFGVGAGFYLNATVPKWKNWRMYDYITSELPAVLRLLPELDVDNASITGHSMGGHGAITIGLRNPYKYKSISAFAPIVNPTAVPWGQKAFAGYLGEADKESWKHYDACEIAKGYDGPARTILIDQGTADDFLENQLKPFNFIDATKGTPVKTALRMQEGYDHSYFFIATFMEDHIEHHARALKA